MLLVPILAMAFACAAPPPAPAPTPEPASTVIPVKLEPTPIATPTPYFLPTQTPAPKAEALDQQQQSAMPSPGAIATIGEPAPDFKLGLFDGESLNLSDLKGDVVVLNFWASWCGPCRQEMPSFERSWLEYKDRGVTFVGVAISDREADAKAFADKTGVTYPLGVDNTREIARAYRPVSLPTTYFIGGDGTITRKLTGPVNEGALRIFIKGQLPKD